MSFLTERKLIFMLWFWALGLYFEGEIFWDNYFGGCVEVVSKIVNIWSSNLHVRAKIGLPGFYNGWSGLFQGTNVCFNDFTKP